MAQSERMPISRVVAGHLEEGSLIRKLFEDGAAMRSDGSGLPVHDLSIGNPQLEPPEEFRVCLEELARSDAGLSHGYMSNLGYPFAREAVAEALSDDHGVEFTAGDVVMTVGAAGAVNLALKALLDPGEEVICLAPHFVEYRFYVEAHGGVPIIVSRRADFDLNLEAIEGAITDRTRVILITNPCNPTGFMYPQETLNGLGEILERISGDRERPIFLLDDAPYRKLVFDTQRCTSCFDAYRNTLMASSHSKDLSLPGERIGFLAVSPGIEGSQKIVDACGFASRVLGHVNAPALMQRICSRLERVTIDLDWYRVRRDLLFGELSRMGYQVVKPQGAFYMFPRAPGGDDLGFVERLKGGRVLTVPGSGFGTPGHFRIAYCVAMETIEGALPVFEEAIRELT